MLDESYPTFFLKLSADKVKHHENYLFTQHGSDPDATYSLHHVDPASNAAKNTYAVALYDSHSPDILYGEVLAKPGWSHPTLSQDEIRRNGGVPPPPQPIYPTEFAIQLYNPDTQVIVKQQSTKWSGTVSWEFSLPQVTFRTPSASTLDRTQDDPGRDANTPRVNFVWRKEGRLGKDMTCYMTGKSTDLMGKKAKRSKEPDIAVALFSGLKEMTVMESNLYRVDLEDYKGLEVVLLLGAAVIRDLFFSDPKEQFHIIEPVSRKLSGSLLARKTSSPVEGLNITPPVMTPQPPPPPPYTGPSQYPQEKVPLQPARGPAENAQIAQPPSHPTSLAAKRSSLPPLQTQAQSSRPSQPQRSQQQPQPGSTRPPRPQQQRPQQSRLQQHPPQPRPQQHPAQTQSRPQQAPPQSQPQQPPRLDPRTQWEIDAETARLKAQVESEQKRQAAAAAKARRKQEADSERKTMHFLEQERKQKEKERERVDKERKRQQAEVDKETERLKKQFGDQSNLLRPVQQQQQRHSVPHASFQQPQRPSPAPLPQGPYMSAPGGHRPVASASSFFGGAANVNGSVQGFKEKVKEKKSFWGLRSQSETSAEKLRKKKSSMF